jgi:DNA-directed RNA polymerase subunit L
MTSKIMPFNNLTTSIPRRKISFEVHDIELAIMNSLRRVLLADIPNVAIQFDPYNDAKDHDVFIEENTCSLHNEILSHRLSLLPICLHPNEVMEFNKLKYQFIINEKNTTNDTMVITTDHIRILDEDGKSYPTDVHARIFPKDLITNDPIIITKLKPNLFDKDNGDELKLQARASVGTASMNAAWSPISLCSFYNKVDEKLCDTAFEASVQSLGLNAEERKESRRRFNTLERFRHFKTHPASGEPRELVFNLESECAMEPVYLIFRALRILTEKVERFITGLMNPNEHGDILDWTRVGDIAGFWQMTMKEETHTLGNLLQSEFYKCIGPSDEDVVLEFVGYHIPHPLEKTMLIKWKFTNENDIDRIRDWILRRAQEIVRDLEKLTRQWIQFSKVSINEYTDIVEFVENMPSTSASTSSKTRDVLKTETKTEEEEEEEEKEESKEQKQKQKQK